MWRVFCPLLFSFFFLLGVFRRAQAHDPAGTNTGTDGNDVASTAKEAMAVAQADALLQAGASKLASLGQRMAATREVCISSTIWYS